MDFSKCSPNIHSLKTGIPVSFLRDFVDFVANQGVSWLKSEFFISKAQATLFPSCYTLHFLFQMPHWRQLACKNNCVIELSKIQMSLLSSAEKYKYPWANEEGRKTPRLQLLQNTVPAIWMGNVYLKISECKFFTYWSFFPIRNLRKKEMPSSSLELNNRPYSATQIDHFSHGQNKYHASCSSTQLLTASCWKEVKHNNTNLYESIYTCHWDVSHYH